jgi:integrase
MTMSRPVRRWRALQGDDISALINSLEYDTLHSALRSIRDKCLIQLGFDGAFRRSELTGIRLRDITFLGERGAEVFLPKSKTDQEGKGFTKAILRRRDPAVCTPCAMRRLITVLEAQASGPSALQAVIDSVQREPDHVCDQLECSLEEEDFLFRPIAPLAATSFKPKMMRGEDVHHMLRERLTTLGYDARQYGAHSLRIGFVTQAAANGATLEEIKHQTGHSSDSMVILYIRLEDAFQNNAVNKLWLDD